MVFGIQSVRLGVRLVLVSVCALGIVACNNDSGLSGGQPLNIEVRPRSVPLTISVSAADGSFIGSKTVAANSPQQTLVFSSVPSNAFVTQIFETTGSRYNSSSKQFVTVPAYTLNTFSAAEAVKYVWLSPNAPATPSTPLTTVYTKITGKPTLPNFSYILGSGYKVIYDASPTEVFDLPSALYSTGLQTDQTFSKFFGAYAAQDDLIGYVAYLDQAVPATAGTAATPNFTIAPADWKTTLNTWALGVSNLGSAAEAYSVDLFAGRKGIFRFVSTGQGTLDAAGKLTLNAKYPSYPPDLFDTFSFNLSWRKNMTSQAGQPYQYSVLFRRGFSSLPDGSSVNAGTDLLSVPSNLAYSESGRPKLSWTYSPQAAVTSFNIGISNQTEDAVYDWSFDSFTKDTSSVTVPALPANLASWDPKGNARKYQFFVTVDDYDATSKSPGGYRYAGASRNFSNDIGTSSLRARQANGTQMNGTQMNGAEQNRLSELQRERK
jgi:hypothetical protein